MAPGWLVEPYRSALEGMGLESMGMGIASRCALPEREVLRGIGSRLLRGNDVFLQHDKAANVFQRMRRFHHLAQMVEPGVGLEHAAGKCAPVDGYDLAVFPALRIADGRYHEAHLQTGFPESLGKFLREEQRVAIAALAEMIDGLIKAQPLWCSVGPIPGAEIESVGPRLQNDMAKNLLPGHSVPLGWSAGWA
jgi:hypothetical protein